MRTYHGSRDQHSTAVWFVDSKEGVARDLPLRLDLRNHSPTGFEWGYSGSGPSQLALALLAHALGDDEEALRWYQDFKCEIVTGLRKEWSLSQEDIRQALCALKRAQRNPTPEP